MGADINSFGWKIPLVNFTQLICSRILSFLAACQSFLIASSVSSRLVNFFHFLEYRFLIEARKLKSKRRKMSEEKVKKAFKKAKKSFIKVLEREGFKPVRFELRGTLRGN